jgi:RNA-directed DNA polymerase
MNVGEMQRKLSQRAVREPDHRFGDLYSLLYNRQWLLAAWHHVRQNAGSRTAGSDGVDRKRFEEEFETHFETLRAALKAGTFEPVPVRRVTIPKPHGVRRLGIPGLHDRIVQEALRMILEPIWEADFHQHSYGFRPTRRTMDAIAYLGCRLTGTGGKTYQWITEGDIAACFDSIPHRKLMKVVARRIEDKKIRRLLWKFLRAGVMVQNTYQPTLTGLPQGAILSPVLANIYLHQLDQYMEEHYLSLSKWQKRQRRLAGQANCLYARYADDFVVLSNGSKRQAKGVKTELHGVLQRLGLTLSLEKTKVTHITDGSQFLGFWLERSIGASGRMVPKARIPQEAIRRFRRKILAVTAPRTYQASVRAKIEALNRIIRGWCQYYQHTGSPGTVFRSLGRVVFWRMAHWLGRKFKVRMPAVMRRFRHGNTLGTKTSRLVMPTDIKATVYRWKPKPNPFTQPARVPLARETGFVLDKTWMGNESRRGRMDLREHLLAQRGLRCVQCGHLGRPTEIEVDHITAHARFKQPSDADVPTNLQILCKQCHSVKTQSDRQVLSRMR